MILSPSIARTVALYRRRAGVLLAALLLLALLSGVAAGASSSASAGAISARLSKKSFTSSQAGSVKLIYKFSKPSKTFSYLVTFKKGAKWQKVKSVKKKGTFKGSKSTTVKKLFKGKAVKVGSYRLKLTCDKGSKTLSFRVIKKSSGSDDATPAVSGLKNTALPSISGTTIQGRTLTASRGSWDGEPTWFSYRWRRCDSSGASCVDMYAHSNSYTLLSADAGHTMRVVVDAFRADGKSSTATSAQTAVVLGLPPENTALPTISGATIPSERLTRKWGSWTNSPDTYRSQWQRCDSSATVCTDISGATSSYYTLVVGDLGYTIRVVVTTTNAYGSTSATSAQTAVVAGSPPVNIALPSMTGTTAQGQWLIANRGTWKYSPTSYSYQWQRCDSSGAGCADISGASTGSYELVLGDVGYTIRVVVKASNSYGTSIDAAASVQTAVVVASTSSVSAGDSHTCALTAGGAVKCWGKNRNGELGDGTTVDRSTPISVSGISTAIQVSAGNSHTCVLLSDHTVRCWGYNGEGELGDDTTDDSLTPVQVTKGGTDYLTGVSQIAAGGSHTCALLDGGAVWCWGYNGDGELGNDTLVDSATPVQVKGTGGSGFLSGASQIATGGSHSCALLSDHSIKCWGYNGDGELGDETTTDSPTPVPVSGISNATQVSAGGYHTCAALDTSEVSCWGYNDSGQLGNDSTTDSTTPVQVKDSGGTSNLTDVSQITTGSFHSCALLSDQTVECWGRNNRNQLGYDFPNDSSIPVVVSGVSTVTQVAAGGNHACALLETGSVKCWGYNWYGQLGNGKKGYESSPAQLISFPAVYDFSAGLNHSCALLSDSIKCWGNNGDGQLGDGTTSSQLSPVTVSGLSSDVWKVSAGGYHTCTLLNSDGDNSVWCWGYNGYGQLGNNTTDDSTAPVQVEYASGTDFLTGVQDIATGEFHTCARFLASGTYVVWCWGSNDSGQLGDNTTTNRSTPVQVKTDGGASDLAGVSQIVAGKSHTCARLDDGTVWCWGANDHGQLGDNTTTPRHTAIQVQNTTGTGNLTGVSQITAGGNRTCARLSDNTAVCWGDNGYGELGNGETDDSPTPVQVMDGTIALAGVSQIETGDSHTCARLSSSVKCWGNNYEGELGDGTTTDSLAPVQVTGLSYVSEISVGGNHTCAKPSGYQLKCWGDNNYGQLGIGVGPIWSPVSVTGLP